MGNTSDAGMLDPQAGAAWPPRPLRAAPAPGHDADPAALLAALARCGDAREIGALLGAWLDRSFAPRGCTVMLRIDGRLEAVYGRERSALLDEKAPDGDLLFPILRDERVLGAVELAGPYDASQGRRPWLALAAQGVAAELERIEAERRAHDARRRAEELSRYVPGAICERIQRDQVVGSGEREISVLFLDIRSYTQHASLLRCSQIFRLINRYVSAASGIISGHGGTVVEFNGDGMMAVFGAPEELPAKGAAAAAAALDLVRAVPPLLRGGALASDRPAVGIGVATGQGFVGDIVARDRIIWSAVGHTTNLASRLEGLARELDRPIVMDEATAREAGERVAGFERWPRTRIRGLEEPVDLYAMPREPLEASGSGMP
jgi:class 3 adenylate cyclase